MEMRMTKTHPKMKMRIMVKNKNQITETKMTHRIHVKNIQEVKRNSTLIRLTLILFSFSSIQSVPTMKIMSNMIILLIGSGVKKVSSWEIWKKQINLTEVCIILLRSKENYYSLNHIMLIISFRFQKHGSSNQMNQKIKQKKQNLEKKIGKRQFRFQLTKSSSIFLCWIKRKRFSWYLTTQVTTTMQW